MHVPDGYLGPQTTVPGFVVMLPTWAAAFKKVKAKLQKKNIPTLALCSAFSFLTMMFNAPVVGGSSAHAVGAVLIAILLGPWAATVCVSTALLIQALVFGDGGILAYGVNCLNMAVIMPFTGYYLYKLFAGSSKIGSSRNLAASFFGSYLGLNLAAFCASLEFGIQPLLFQGGAGHPLYCPYPLSVSIPSMMTAHLLIAGPIEGILTAAAVAYIAKVTPQIFSGNGSPTGLGKVSFFQKYRNLLIPIIVMVVLTPLGLIATGTAWGEWGTDEIKDALGYIPQGLASMSDRWNAIMPDYSLPVLGDGQVGSIAGYILSALVGILLISFLIFLMSRLITKNKKGTGQK
ncbi:cobalt transporter CbiM [Caproiciproducens sp. NJN-50]|uniref:cobalt transporter CbiM n=1 Tax=Acutalibacteraceae TaxID=3082771 RepID=UPI000FFE0336|nr:MULTISPECIES: cobalt transporter CbiM [Acutalibacteraceae]QAT50097.1 cobalt transporter CbiM [Caproiciproducens sp. NJN-50]